MLTKAELTQLVLDYPSGDHDAKRTSRIFANKAANCDLDYEEDVLLRNQYLMMADLALEVL